MQRPIPEDGVGLDSVLVEQTSESILDVKSDSVKFAIRIDWTLVEAYWLCPASTDKRTVDIMWGG